MSKVKLVFAVGLSSQHDYSDCIDYHFGNNGALPWNAPEELKHFKAETKGTVLVMGSSTFLSLPGKLPGRPHVVLSSKGEHIRTKDGKTADMVLSGGNLATTLDAVRNSYPDQDISIIGGKSLIEEAIKYNIADEIVISFIVPVFGDEFESDVKLEYKLLEINPDDYERWVGQPVWTESSEDVFYFYVERWEKV